MKHAIYLLLTLLSVKLPVQDKITDYIVKDPGRIHFYYKNEKSEKFNTIQNVKEWLQSKKKQLIFATNGGMFTPEYSPVGLYIENFRKIIGVTEK